MTQIRFKHRLTKLRNENKALLIGVFGGEFKNLSKEFIKYDTEISKGKYYELKDLDKILILYFVGEENGIPFTSIRKNNFKNNKYYKLNLNKEFNLIIEDELNKK